MNKPNQAAELVAEFISRYAGQALTPSGPIDPEQSGILFDVFCQTLNEIEAANGRRYAWGVDGLEVLSQAVANAVGPGELAELGNYIGSAMLFMSGKAQADEMPELRSAVGREGKTQP